MNNDNHRADEWHALRGSRADNEPIRQPAPPDRSKDLPELPDPSDVGESG